MDKHPIAGFTLVEMAVVLVIVGLLLGGLIVPLTAQMEMRDRQQAQNDMANIKQAILGYALTHLAADGKPYLPCPDTDGNGTENRNNLGSCSKQEGGLPWADLGLPSNTPWGAPYFYHVSPLFSNSKVGFTLATNGNIKVLQSAAGATLASGLPFVIVARGANGAGAGNDEKENGDGDTDFVSHAPSNAVGNEFDDLVDWVPVFVLANQMVSAQVLP